MLHGAVLGVSPRLSINFFFATARRLINFIAAYDLRSEFRFRRLEVSWTHKASPFKSQLKSSCESENKRNTLNSFSLAFVPTSVWIAFCLLQSAISVWSVRNFSIKKCAAQPECCAKVIEMPRTETHQVNMFMELHFSIATQFIINCAISKRVSTKALFFACTTTLELEITIWDIISNRGD